MKRFKVEKLIRDNLPDILEKKGVTFHKRTLDQDAYIASLKDKLLEEAEEVTHAKNAEELTEELADVLEVAHALAQASGISPEEIEKARLEKRKIKGGFNKRIYCACMDMDENNSLIDYFLKKSEHYPLVEPAHQSDCLFCQFSSQEKKVEFVATFTHCYAIKDAFPVSNGHILIIPNEHTENWFTAKEEVRLDMIRALHILKARLDVELQPHGYNIGANCGTPAGQSVMHLHLHLIPRYSGDMENPKGGVRGVIPEKQHY
jgi:diadenosine tetraphosphate (Ap4A) HIT family hydrolase/predicted house-cleaning noncanonical NTP pyrophosphatase (MazG superfamily)